MEALNTFWQINFWGIVGTITGVVGLFVSWFTFKYNTPNIEIDKMDLVIPDWAKSNWKGKAINDLKSSFLDYELEIVIRNRRGGAGSIDKPNLLIKIPDGKHLLFLPKYRIIVVNPQTEHTESKKESENITNIWTVRHGRAFNLGGGEKVDEKLEYEVEKPEMIYAIVQNFDKLQYFAEYWDNNGKHYEK
ncbi:MAG: hypothetical protein ACD_37C00121G0001, partial [uncultured bacterium]